jgi:hypothetical protein
VLGSWLPPTGSGVAQGQVTITPTAQMGEGGRIVVAEPIVATLDATGSVSQVVASANQLPQLRVSEQIVGAPAFTYVISPPVARTDAVTNVSGTATVTDAAVVTGDSGKAVAGVGVPIVSYVGTVTPGVSFTLVNAAGAPVNTTAAVTSVVVGAVDLSTIARNTGSTVQPYVPGSAVGQVGGPAGPLDGTGKLPAAQLPTQATGVQSVTATNGTIVVTNVDPVNPTVAIGVGIPEAAVTNLVTDLAGRVPLATVTAKGDLLVATGNATVARLGVGADLTVPIADASQATGLRYGAVATQPRQAGTGLLLGTFGPGGATGQPTTLSPSAWWVTVTARVGDLLLWVPSILSTGADATGDLASVVNGSPVNFYSNGYGPTQAINGHGGLYLSGDFGVANYAPVKWLVQAGDLSGGAVTLAFLYQGGTGSHVWGHASIPSQVDVLNLGVHG